MIKAVSCVAVGILLMLLGNIQYGEEAFYSEYLKEVRRSSYGGSVAAKPDKSLFMRFGEWFAWAVTDKDARLLEAYRLRDEHDFAGAMKIFYELRRSARNPARKAELSFDIGQTMLRLSMMFGVNEALNDAVEEFRSCMEYVPDHKACAYSFEAVQRNIGRANSVGNEVGLKNAPGLKNKKDEEGDENKGAGRSVPKEDI